MAKNDGYIYDIPVYITEKALAETSVKLNPAGSILIAMYGATIGKVGILTFPATTNQACCACVDYYGIEQKYLFYFLISHKEEFIMQGGGGAQPNISKEKILETLIPIPPYSEQIRIVNTIKKWFSIIDQLEQEQTDLKDTIKRAKSKILDLAIHGKLVPQDPNDEPAIDLLRRINPSFKPCDNAHYRQLPKSWKVIYLGDICRLSDGEVISITGLPYLDVKSLRNQTYTTKDNGKFIKAGTTLILVDGENSGEIFHATFDGYQGSTMKILNINSNINQLYVLNFIKLHQKALREKVRLFRI